MSSILRIVNLPATVPVWVFERIAKANRVRVLDVIERTSPERAVYLCLQSPRDEKPAMRSLSGCEINGEIITLQPAPEDVAEAITKELAEKPAPPPEKPKEANEPKESKEPKRASAPARPPKPDPFRSMGECIEPGEDGGLIDFKSLNLDEKILTNLAKLNFETSTPIQGLSIPPILEGRDLVGRAETGSGKTLAFALPIVQRFIQQKGSGVRALILAPTRELAIQIKEGFDQLTEDTGIDCIVLYGGENILDQMIELRNNIQIVIATPGRLLDMQSRGRLRFDAAEILVLDEADRMLDMGFWPQIRSIMNCFYAHPQTLFFSATIPDEVKKFMNSWLEKPVIVDLGGPSLTPIQAVKQEILYVEDSQKDQKLFDILDKEPGSVLVFVRTKRSAEHLSARLKNRKYPATRIHGDIEQADRFKAVDAFKEGRFRILVATDVAARGLHVDDIAHVVNYDLALQPEDHVHRIGRTARAGAKGHATTFITQSDKRSLRRYKVVLGLED